MKRKQRRILQDERKRRNVLTAISLGCSVQAAARLVGCSPSTIRREAELNEEFGEAFSRVQGDSEVTYMQRIYSAAEKAQYWRAAAWVLERRHPEHYAARSPDVITVSQIATLISKIAQIIEEEVPVAEFRRRILRRLDALTTELQPPPPPKPREADNAD